MAFVNIGTYSVKQERRGEFLALMGRISEHMRNNPEVFKSIKGHKLYSTEFGGPYGEFIDMWEFENWNEYDEYLKTYGTDKVWAGLWGEVMGMVDPSLHKWSNLTEVQ